MSGQLVGKVQIVKSDSLFRYSYNTITILTDVVDFELRDEYMYATKSVVRSSFRLYVCYSL